jgi:putative ABC transport system permease protein
MENLLRDLRLASRSLRRTPGFTAAAVITLALGIGATTALFSVVDAVLLRPLFNQESRLVSLSVDFTGDHLLHFSLSVPELKDLETVPAFESVGGYLPGTAALQGSQTAERVKIATVTSGFFSALGVQPRFGRAWTPEEDRKGAPLVVLLTDQAFRKRYAGDPAIVGRDVTLDGRSRRVLGVLPQGFAYDGARDYFVPFELTEEQLLRQRGAHYLQGVARLKPGVTLQGAQAALQQLTERDLAAYKDEYPPEAGFRFGLEPLRDRFVSSSREPLLLLFGAVFLVLLIACANVANLMLARGASRQAEMAVRAALGAARARLLRQLLTESALLAFLGAGLGVLTAQWALSGLLLAAPRRVRELASLTPDPRVLGFSLVITVACTFLFGLWPSLRASRVDLNAALKDSARTMSGGARLRSLLVIAQFALSLALLAGAGLVLRSFSHLLQISPGYEAEGLLAVRLVPGGAAYEDDAFRQKYFDRALSTLSALPGVQEAGAIDRVPLEGDYRLSYAIEGYVPPQGEPSVSDLIRRAMPGYFHTMRQAVVAGREVTAGDDAKAPFVALVNEAWVRRYFPGREVIGKRIRSDQKDAPWRTIVGVVADAHEQGLDKPSPPIYYFAAAQEPPDKLTVVLRSSQPLLLAGPARAAVARLDAAVPPGDIAPLTDTLSTSLAPRRFPLQLLACFALLALVLSGVGIYGVTAYGVAQRTRELGVRMAVGASGADVLRLVLRQALVLAGAGVGIGALAALASAKVIASQLYGVSARDPLTFLAVVGVLSLVALVASAVPAIRASRIDPMTALRSE